MTLGENIVRLRTQKNWSQGDLADALDISRQSVSQCAFGARQHFACAHTCCLAHEAGREESGPQYSGDLGEYCTLSKCFTSQLLYILTNHLGAYLPKRHIYKKGRMM